MLRILNGIVGKITPSQSVFDHHFIADFDRNKFIKNTPFPHFSFQNFLRPEVFSQLVREFPSLDLFGVEENVYRKGTGQRPHDRYYMCYGNTYEPNLHMVQKHQLPLVWQKFVTAIENDKKYHEFICHLLGIDGEFRLRLDWHAANWGKDVSPHLDSKGKYGSHLFYFNDDVDWRTEWGGEIMALEGKKIEGMNPEIHDFEKSYRYPIMNGRSFLFKNTPNAWHGVDQLKCPEDRFRKICSVVFLKGK